MSAAAETGFRALALGPYEGKAEQRADGSWMLRNAQPMKPYKRAYTEHLIEWAEKTPDAVLLAKRAPSGDWMTLTYAEALAKARRLAQALLDRSLSAERPLVILSGNDLEHALLGLAAMHVGIPVAPISPAYSLLAKDGTRVKHAIDLLTPGLVFASDAEPFAHAIDLAVPETTELAFTRGSLLGRRCTSFETLLATEPTPAVDAAHSQVNGDTIAKFMFTSGSTKLPKAVINTHRMLCSNQIQQRQCYPYLADEKPVMVDWLPWHHTAGGNADFGMVMFHGGTMYIDDGKPTTDGIAETIRNLREISPTCYYTVPKGLEELVHELNRDEQLRRTFFKRLKLIFPAGAAMPVPLKRAFDKLAVEACGARIPMTMGLGQTESGPFAVSAHLPDWQPGLIGLPAPGCEVKLAPVGDKLEVRYRGPNITPGYWRQPELAAETFDDEGFFCSGDAARFIDEAHPERGLIFDGRIAEDFKLVTGTWANVGALRHAVISAGSPYIQDAVITGHGRDYLGMLVFLLPAAAQLSKDLPADAPPERIAADPLVRAWLQRLIDELAARATGSSNRIDRAIALTTFASMASGEMTDKGSINQRAVLKARAAFVEALYAEPPGPEVLLAAKKGSA